MSVTADHNQETSVDYLPPLSPYAYQPMTRRQPGQGWKVLEVFTPLHFRLVTDMGRYYVNGSLVRVRKNGNNMIKVGMLPHL